MRPRPRQEGVLVPTAERRRVVQRRVAVRVARVDVGARTEQRLHHDRVVGPRRGVQERRPALVLRVDVPPTAGNVSNATPLLSFAAASCSGVSPHWDRGACHRKDTKKTVSNTLRPHKIVVFCDDDTQTGGKTVESTVKEVVIDVSVPTAID